MTRRQQYAKIVAKWQFTGREDRDIPTFVQWLHGKARRRVNRTR